MDYVPTEDYTYETLYSEWEWNTARKTNQFLSFK
jgi:hypothetical protein